MVEVSYVCPLKIPKGYTLSYQKTRRYDNGFSQSLTLDQAVGYLEEEIRGTSAGKVTVYSNYERLNIPRLRVKAEDDSAICVELGIGKKSYYLVCDAWYLTEHNVYALHLGIRAIRNMEKWGLGDIHTIMAGFSSGYANTAQDIAAASSTLIVSDGVAMPDWMEYMGLGPTATLEDANAMYRHRAKLAVNDDSQMVQLNQAIEAARKYYAG